MTSNDKYIPLLMRHHKPAMDAVINETIVAPMRARGAIFVSAGLRDGAKTPIVAKAMPIEPKLAKPN